MNSFILNSRDLSIRAGILPWDVKVLGVNVASISNLEINNELKKQQGFPSEFWNWIDLNNVKLISCRLPITSFPETKFLESEDFNFVEVALHPHLRKISSFQGETNDFIATPLDPNDVSEIAEMAQTAFRYERFHADPRIDDAAASLRYKNWVENLSAFSDQNALKILDPRGETAGFFIYTVSSDGDVDWLLTALGDKHRGQGFGYNAWSSVLEFHKHEKHRSVSTTITAQNSPVLRLYGQLGFSYLPPEVTFHWVNPEVKKLLGSNN